MNSRHLLLATLFLAACSPSVSDLGMKGGSSDGPVDAPPVSGLGEDWGLEPKRLDYFEGLLAGDAQRQSLCSRGNADRLTKWWCAEPRPTVTKLEDVLIGLNLKNPANLGAMRFAISGHSSSLVTRKTSVLNPRAIIFNPANANAPDYIALGFVRGDGFAEIAAKDPVKNDLNFFVIRFKKACDPECGNAMRFGPDAERDWVSVDIYGDQDLKNTVLDCLQCHQPGGVTARRMLRMQELQDPWTHWFRDNRPSVALLDQFQAAHPNEDYAGIPANLIRNSDPADLEDFVRGGGFDAQPNEFPTDTIATQLQQNPNQVPPAWMAIYQHSLAGAQIAVPFYEISPYDPAKVLSASEAYKGVVIDKTMPDSALPELNELFREDALGYLSFRAGDMLATSKEVVQHRCGTCHNGTFPGISRNNFDINQYPDGLSPEMKAKILQRIAMPKSSRLRMPPLFFSELTPDQIGLIQQELQ